MALLVLFTQLWIIELQTDLALSMLRLKPFNISYCFGQHRFIVGVTYSICIGNHSVLIYWSAFLKQLERYIVLYLTQFKVENNCT